MKPLLLNFNLNYNGFQEKDVLAVFKKNKPKPTEIVQGMTPDEIAEIVSERIMENIRAQFKNIAEQLQQRKPQ